MPAARAAGTCRAPAPARCGAVRCGAAPPSPPPGTAVRPAVPGGGQGGPAGAPRRADGAALADGARGASPRRRKFGGGRRLPSTSRRRGRGWWRGAAWGVQPQTGLRWGAPGPEHPPERSVRLRRSGPGRDGAGGVSGPCQLAVRGRGRAAAARRPQGRGAPGAGGRFPPRSQTPRVPRLGARAGGRLRGAAPECKSAGNASAGKSLLFSPCAKTRLTHLTGL